MSANYDSNDQDIDIVLPESTVAQFNENMRSVFFRTRPGYEECLLRCNVLNLINEIWQNCLIEKEQNAMIDTCNPKYTDIITDETSIEIVDIQTGKHEPYRKSAADYLVSSDGSDSPDSTNPHSNHSTTNRSTSNCHQNAHLEDVWCTPVVGREREIVLRECEGGPIVKKVRIPSVMIFGSIAFGLDGRGSDIDIALPAAIDQPAVNAHQDGKLQTKLLREFINRLKLNMSSSLKLGLEWKLEPILHARVPIVKLTEMKRTNGKLQVDVGIRSTQMPITRLISYYCSFDDRVSVFYLFVKQWSKQRRISDAMYGFPNSFGFVMLATKFLQILSEPVIPIVDFDRLDQKVQVRHSIKHFRRNTQSLLELAVAFFDFYATFDFESYQISITAAGLQWKHAKDYNLNHDDQATMIIEDPSSKQENVTRCLKPYNLRVMKQEFFRAFKCARHGNWDLLFKPYNDRGEPSIFEIYPPEDEWEEGMRYEIEAVDQDWEYGQYDQYQNGGQSGKTSQVKSNEAYYDEEPQYQTTRRKKQKNRNNKSPSLNHVNGSKMYKVKQKK